MAPRDLPTPDASEAAHSERLQQMIRHEIEQAGGRMTFARYMELALYAPGLGYYSAGFQKFGAGGDFTTAPEISALFACCIARQCQQVLRQVPESDILEVGAGSGAMACDVLIECERLGCLPRQYLILELSAELRARQQVRLEQCVPHLMQRVRWLDGLPQPGFRGVVLANEVLDAMPVHRFRLDEGVVSERLVGHEAGRFVWRHGPVSDAELAAYIDTLLPAMQGAPTVLESEAGVMVSAWISSVAQVIEQGLLLLIDYGYPRHEFYHPQRVQGTLQCHYRHHAHADPFRYPGLQDITAHVDFTAVAEAGHGAGLDVAGYTSQAFFLLACGLMDRVGEMGGAGSTAEQLALMQQVKRLTLPDEMGELFKVIALTRGIDTPLLGFSMRDNRGKL
ncbi:MAG: SAM-dependent methyltransferase [Gammaproteobacteria bacterium]|nr:SAM-dependent methyltransferase [Gammaproteobacteria bacterium]